MVAVLKRELYRSPVLAVVILALFGFAALANGEVVYFEPAPLPSVPQEQAALIFYEPFSASVFAENTFLGNTSPNGWSIGNSASKNCASTVSSIAALSYEGLETESDSLGVVRVANTSMSHRNAGRPFNGEITAGSVYCSFLMKAVTLPTANRSVAALLQSVGSNSFNSAAASLWLDSKGRLLIGKRSETSATEATAALGDKTVFVVLKYTFKEGSDNDEVALYLNPQPGMPEPTKPTLSLVSGSNVNRLVAFGLPQGRGGDTPNGADSGEIYMDEIRVGTEWGCVTPASVSAASTVWKPGQFTKSSPGVSISGEPKIIDSPYGKAAWFDGKDDAFFLDKNPLAGLKSFTIEAIFCPDLGGKTEQRFLHMGEAKGSRMLLETRTTETSWYLDCYIQSGSSGKVLISPELLHPLGQWYHLALTVDNGDMKSYVNGKLELQGHLDFTPINTGSSSVGVRLNKVCWFDGAIYSVRVTPRVLTPDGFTMK